MDSLAKFRDEMRAMRLLDDKIGLGAPVESIVDYLFSRQSKEEREALVRVFRKAGMHQGSDLHKRTFGYLCDELHLPERVCKVLLDRGLLQMGGPREVMWYGKQSYEARPHGAHKVVPPELDAIAGAAGLEFEKMKGYAMLVQGKTWIQVAQDHMSEEERADALCNPAVNEIIYGYRAMLRIISQVLPVKMSLVESRSFMGTLYLVDADDHDHGSSSTKKVDIDWTRVVWVLQAKPPEMHYFDAMGRVVMSVEKTFEHQPRRKFVVGVIGCADVLDIFMFWAKDRKLMDGKMVPVPRSVTNTMLTLHRIHSGVEVLMMFMCAPCDLFGFDSTLCASCKLSSLALV